MIVTICILIEILPSFCSPLVAMGQVDFFSDALSS